jgi:hypothetical protein
MDDTPTTNETNWPADITKKVTMEFEVAAFCTAGDDIGEFFGKFTWKSEKEAGQAQKATLVSPPLREQPSQDFQDALNKWLANHPDFKLPQLKAPRCP